MYCAIRVAENQLSVNAARAVNEWEVAMMQQ
jgi:hypothetical protein